MKDREKRLEELKSKVQARWAEYKKTKKRCAPNPPPRYDDVYFRGLEWLESLGK